MTGERAAPEPARPRARKLRSPGGPQGWSNGELRYVERKLSEVEDDRCRPIGPEDVAEIVAAYASPDPLVRARALQRSCPCHIPWEVYDQVRKQALRLREDPDARVRSLAEHLEDDARMLLAFEARRERHRERQEKLAERRRERARRGRDRRR